MKFVSSCPCAVRVVASIEGRLCNFFVRSARMRLSDKNERARYGRSVLNDEVERCPTPSGEGEVNCLADCGGGVRGVEFKSYMGRSEGRGGRVGGMWSELSRKRVLGDLCGSRCSLALVVFEEDLTYAREEAESAAARPRVGIAYTVDELAQKVCSYDIVLLVVRQAGDCCR
ncbi:MAG: hypothetical protein LM562_06410 [Pyrobaculum sp.]|nr:hypothetical protein [Pyrobaculum sp.]